MDQTKYVPAYHRAHERIVLLVEQVNVGALVRACPGWRFRDVLAHVTGIAVDFQDGRPPTGDVSDWTARQVAARAGLPVDEVVREWESRVAGFEEAMRGPLAAAAHNFTADVISHYYDLAGTVEASVDRDDPDVMVALDTFAAMLHRRVSASGMAPIEISVGGGHWMAGAADRLPGACLRTTPFEALRVLSGRRTPGEIAKLDWSGPPDSYTAILSAFPFPAASLEE
jgi:uncharacterized protein (TIGR03083 family)